MTFQEIIQKDPTIWTAEIKDIDKKTITDWFQFREVCDDEKFKVFFQRILNTNYHLYLEKQRLEPGYARYDWLVNQYLELQRKNKSTLTGSRDGTSGAKTTATREIDYKNTNNSTNENISNSTSNSENSNTTTNNLSNSSTTAVSSKNNQTQKTTSSNENTSATFNSGDSVSANKELPFESSNIPAKNISVKYKDQVIGSFNGIGPLDFTAATSQSETTNFSSQSNNGQSMNSSSISYEGEADTVSTTASTTDTGTVTAAGTGKVINATTDNMSVSGSSTNKGNETNNNQVNSSNSENHSENSENDETLQQAGRQGNIAAILEEASSFIETSSAFTWFRKQLETCFINVFEI